MTYNEAISEITTAIATIASTEAGRRSIAEALLEREDLVQVLGDPGVDYDTTVPPETAAVARWSVKEEEEGPMGPFPEDLFRSSLR